MKPPRAPDDLTKGREVSPKAIREHLDKINKILTRISFGTSVPNATAPGQTMTGNVEPDRNIDCWKATGTTPGAADTDFTISHNLGRIPTTIGGQDTNNGGLLYRSPVTVWTTTTVTLRCTKASSNFIVVLI